MCLAIRLKLFEMLNPCFDFSLEIRMTSDNHPYQAKIEQFINSDDLLRLLPRWNDLGDEPGMQLLRRRIYFFMN